MRPLVRCDRRRRGVTPTRLGATTARVSVDVHGEVAPGFSRVRDAFVDNFERHGEVGAACCVYHRGAVVVDLWAGMADRKRSRPWRRETATLVFSVTKGITAACVLLLVERGVLDLSTPVAAYWPEFGAAGKEAIPLAWVLCHRAGVPVVDAPLTLEQVLAWEPVVAATAAQAPVWEPGTRHGYHFRTYGWVPRRGRPARHRQDPRHVLRRRDRHAARPGFLDRASRVRGGPRCGAGSPAPAAGR